MRTIHIAASAQYDVRIGAGLLAQAGQQIAACVPGRRAMLVSDTNVAPLYLESAARSLAEAGFSCERFILPAGEASKTPENYLRLIAALAEARFTRADAVVALGGGVAGDLAGFAAATYLRGIRLIQIPTTLLACVDSSVGGKTAVDLPQGKNLLGAFYQPALVLCDPQILDTLPDAVWADGCAEVIKYGMIGSEALLRRLLAMSVKDQREDVIAACVEMKRDAVQTDEFDTGRRQFLNFGHTFAHSIERLSDYRIPHGSAVAIGMRIITRAAVRKDICSAEAADILERLLEKYHLPLCSPYGAKALAEAALSDKKRSGEHLTLVVPTGVGASELRKVEISSLADWAEAGLDA